QGALARAVLADQGVDLAGERRERRLVQRGDRAVPFGDPDRFDGRHGHLFHAGRVMVSGPGHGVPVRAASTHIVSTGLGPVSVMPVKKLSSRSGKTVVPTSTVSWVTAGKGITTSRRGLSPRRICRASSSATSARYGGCAIDSPRTLG